MKKRITKILAGAMALCLMVGTFAFFTDKESQQTKATAGNINLVFTDASLAKEHKQTTQTNTRDNVWTSHKITADDNIMNPGDTFDLGYKLSNTGSKSIDVKQILTVTSDVAMTEDAEEYTLTIAGETITPTKNENNTVLTYNLADIVLSGSVEEDGTAIDKDYDVSLNFDLAAKNDFMNKGVAVDLQVYAKQHRNAPDAGWAQVANYEAIA